MNTEVEFAKLWEPGISGIKLFSTRLFHHAFSKHMHEAYTIGINDGGQGCFTYQGKACCTYPGSFNLLNPGEVHTGQATSDAGWIYRNIYISVPLVEQILAQLVQLSPYYLIRSFGKHIGLPPHEYQRHWQLLQAKRALRTSKSLCEVAIEHGFYDQSHLTRHFKRAWGMG